MKQHQALLPTQLTEWTMQEDPPISPSRMYACVTSDVAFYSNRVSNS